MTLEEILGTARALAVAEQLPATGDVSQDAVLKYLDRFGHLVNMMFAVEVKELELLELRKAVAYKTVPATERGKQEINSLREQILLLIQPPRW